jgi:hypothetical protein
MVQLRERPLFGGESLAARWRQPRVAQDLDRRLAAEVRSLGEVHDPHAAFAEHRRDAVRPEAVERHHGGRRRVQHCLRHVRDVAVEERVAARVLLEHRHHLGGERRVVGALGTHVGRALGLGQVGREVEDGLHALPA